MACVDGRDLCARHAAIGQVSEGCAEAALCAAIWEQMAAGASVIAEHCRRAALAERVSQPMEARTEVERTLRHEVASFLEKLHAVTTRRPPP